MLVWLILGLVVGSHGAPTEDTLVGSPSAPTEDTLVVSRTQDTTPAPVTTSTTIATDPQAQDVSTPKAAEVSSEAPDLPIKVTSMTVNADVSLRYARTAVVTNVRNPGTTAKEHVFAILLPETAFISGFVMTLDGKSYKAYVKEKVVAKAEYDAAVSQGIAAAHVAAKARDSNHFRVAVNVEPRSEAVFNLTYEELLEREHGLYEMAINLHPGALVPKLDVTVNIKEPSAITVLAAPSIRTGNEIDHVSGGEGNPLAKIVKSEDGKEATVTFSPNIEEQKELMRVYAQKSRESKERDQPRYYSFGRTYNDNVEVQKENDVLGQFVVQYDVDRPAGGEVLVNDGYFVHFFAPKSLPPINKHVVFVLDTSGSMMDRKIIQLREAMISILGELHEGDFFSIVQFASAVKVHNLTEVPQNDQRWSDYDYTSYLAPSKLYPPAQASKDNIDKAKNIVSKLEAAGGTNIASALSTALELIQKGVGWNPEETKEAEIANSTPALGTTSEPIPELPKPEPLTAEDKDDSDTPKLESIIIFLTDGDPTVGETNPKRIINRIVEKNYGSNKAAIFSLAFGEDADRSFLRKISLSNEGFMRHIYEASDAALQLKNFYEQVASPLLSHVKFIYPKEQIEEGSLTKHQFRTYYKGSEVVVAGRVAKELETFEPEVQGFCGVTDEYEGRKFKGKPRVEVRREASILPLERLWAYLTMKQRLDQIDAAEATDQKKEVKEGLEKEALKLALKYSFVTPLTSLVVVKPNSTAAVDAESVDKIVPDAVPFASFISDPVQHQYASPVLMPQQASFLSAGPDVSAGALILEDAVDSVPDSILAADYFVPVSLRSGVADYMPSSFTLGQTLNMSPARRFNSPHSGPFSKHNFPAPMAYSGAMHTSLPLKHTYIPSMTMNSKDAFLISGPISQGGPIQYPSTPSVQPDAFVASTTSAPVPSERSKLQPYALEKFSFLEPYLNETADDLVLPVDGKNVTFKLNKHGEPHVGSQVISCSHAVDGGEGSCVHLLDCSAATNITSLDQFLPHHCSRDGYLGVCCPNEKEVVTQALSTPLTDLIPDQERIIGGQSGIYPTKLASDLAAGQSITSTIELAPQTTEVILTSTAVSDVNGLRVFGLENFNFLAPYINETANTVVLPVNGQNITFKLSRGIWSEPIVGGAECSSAVSGGAGTCWYLPACSAASTIASLDQYLTHQCSRDGYLGVCCPKVEPLPLASPSIQPH